MTQIRVPKPGQAAVKYFTETAELKMFLKIKLFHVFFS